MCLLNVNSFLKVRSGAVILEAQTKVKHVISFGTVAFDIGARDRLGNSGVRTRKQGGRKAKDIDLPSVVFRSGIHASTGAWILRSYGIGSEEDEEGAEYVFGQHCEGFRIVVNIVEPTGRGPWECGRCQGSECKRLYICELVQGGFGADAPKWNG